MPSLRATLERTLELDSLADRRTKAWEAFMAGKQEYYQTYEALDKQIGDIRGAITAALADSPEQRVIDAAREYAAAHIDYARIPTAVPEDEIARRERYAAAKQALFTAVTTLDP